MKLVSNSAAKGKPFSELPLDLKIENSETLPAVVQPPLVAAEDVLNREAKEFDWVNDDSIVLHHQPGVAVYINSTGGLTIRQERDWNQDEDIVIAIAPNNIAEFLDKITDVCGVPSFP